MRLALTCSRLRGIAPQLHDAPVGVAQRGIGARSFAYLVWPGPDETIDDDDRPGGSVRQCQRLGPQCAVEGEVKSAGPTAHACAIFLFESLRLRARGDRIGTAREALVEQQSAAAGLDLAAHEQ